MGLQKKDIELANYALSKMWDFEYSGADIADLTKRAESKFQVERISKSFVDMGIARRTAVALIGNYDTRAIISEGGAIIIYQKEQDDKEARRLERTNIKLSISTQRRTKWMSIVSLVISIFTFFYTIFNK